MKKYKGYYIDNAIFHSKEEIDAFIKEQAIDAFKQAVEYFHRKPTIETSIHADEMAERLHKTHGFTWEEIEKMELTTLRLAALI